LWAGPESSLDKVLKAMSSDKLIEASVQEEILRLQNDRPGEEKPSRLLEVSEGVGIVSITGELVSTTSWWNRIMGMTSYDEVREAMTQAATDPSVKQILLDISSPGGTVTNLGDTAGLISMVDKKIKPVTSYTASTMASAAYWLGSSARKTYASNTAVVGSIGVIVKHIEYSKQLEKEGITPTIMRTGKYKALGTKLEPLTQMAKDEIMGQADTFFDIFTSAISDNTGLSVQTIVDFEGRDYIGEAALDAGLVDGIESFNDVVQKLQKKALDTKQPTAHNSNSYSVGGNSMKTILTEEAVALAAQGITSDEGLTAEQIAEAAATAEAELKAIKDAADLKAADEAAKLEADGGTTPVKTETEPSEEMVALQAEVDGGAQALAEKETELTAIAETMATMKVELEALQASNDSLKDIALASVGQMRVALRLASVDLSEMSAENILIEHAQVLKPFSAKFKVGGVAAAKTEDAEDNQAKINTPGAMEMAALGAVKLTP